MSTSASANSPQSYSPQTPFDRPAQLGGMPQSPPKALPIPLGKGSPPVSALGPLSPGASSGNFFKWAAASLGKSPTATNPLANGGMSIPQSGQDDHHGDHALENHDSFEFGDLDDLKSRSWATGRRAASMSQPSGRPSGISSMLTGFGASPMSPTETSSGSSILADNAAKGQGIMRRLSISGSFPRQSAIFSPPLGGPGPSPANMTQPAPAPAPVAAPVKPIEPPQPDPATVQRAATIGGKVDRGRERRFSEGKKRGVSPMGERILRDHGHF